jgi:hypothetical protein
VSFSLASQGLTELFNHRLICPVRKQDLKMRPIMTADDIIDDVHEALARYPMRKGIDPITLAVIIADIHSNGRPPGEAGFGIIYQRVVSRWYLRVDRIDLAEGMGWPFKLATVRTEHSCDEAKARYAGVEFTMAGQLPVLPLTDCSLPWCKCSLRGHADRKRRR